MADSDREMTTRFPIGELEEELTISNRFLLAVNMEVSIKDSETGSEFNPAEVERFEVERFEDEPYYFEQDERDGYRNNHKLTLSMNNNSAPTLNALVSSCKIQRSEETIWFEQGMWVEYLSSSME